MIKKIILIVLLIGAVYFVNAQGIVFEKLTFEECLKKAKAEDKLLFIDFYTEWCGPCKRVSREVFPKKDIGDFYNKHFVNLKIDAEKGEGPELAKKYKIDTYPTFLFINFKGEIIHKKIGVSKNNSHDDIAELGRIAIDPKRNQYGMNKRYESGDRSPEFIKIYLSNLKRQEDPKWKEVFDSYFKDTPKEEFINQTGLIFLLNYATFNSAAMDFVFDYKDEYEKVLNEMYNKIVYNFNTGALGILKDQKDHEKYNEAYQYLASKMGSGFEKFSDYVEYSLKITKEKKVNEGFMLAIQYAHKYGPEEKSIYKSIASWISYTENINDDVLKGAVELIDEAIEIDPKNEISYLDIKVALLYRLDMKKESQEILKKVLKNTPENKQNGLISAYVMRMFK